MRLQAPHPVVLLVFAISKQANIYLQTLKKKLKKNLTSAFGFVSSSSLTLARFASLLTASLTKCFKLFTVLYKLTVVDIFSESPNGNAEGILVENETCACRNEPGWYSSSHSTTLQFIQLI